MRPWVKDWHNWKELSWCKLCGIMGIVQHQQCEAQFVSTCRSFPKHRPHESKWGPIIPVQSLYIPVVPMGPFFRNCHLDGVKRLERFFMPCTRMHRVQAGGIFLQIQRNLNLTMKGTYHPIIDILVDLGGL